MPCGCHRVIERPEQVLWIMGKHWKRTGPCRFKVHLVWFLYFQATLWNQLLPPSPSPSALAPSVPCRHTQARQGRPSVPVGPHRLLPAPTPCSSTSKCFPRSCRVQPAGCEPWLLIRTTGAWTPAQKHSFNWSGLSVIQFLKCTWWF